MREVYDERMFVDNIIDFKEEKEVRLALANKEPPSGGNWLSKLPKETRFLASPKSFNTSRLIDFLIASDPTKMDAVLLGVDLGTRAGGFEWHDPAKFSREYIHYMTIEVEIEHGSSPIQTGTVEGDGTVEVIDSLHERE